MPAVGITYVAAALLRQGHEVRILEAAGRGPEGMVTAMIGALAAWRPEMVGVGLWTGWMPGTYAWLGALRRQIGGRLWVAGGGHATACPAEVLEQGFDVAAVGEAEETLCELAEVVAGKRGIETVKGIWRRDGQGGVAGGRRRVTADLDGLADAWTAGELFAGEWYGQRTSVAWPGGVITSRGCPAKCTFCANHVTGRRVRHRSPARVVEELNGWHRLTGQTFYSFLDDALTADEAQTLMLAEAVERGANFPLQWNGMTRAGTVTPAMLRALRRSGLLAINFGVESGDDELLAAIGKGQTVAEVERAVRWSKEAGLLTTCNFMMGFPGETAAGLEKTLACMERLGPWMDHVGGAGLVAPLPGTALYARHHAAYGFSRWWLREKYRGYSSWTMENERYGGEVLNLGLDFFRYDEAQREVMRAIVAWKREHNGRAAKAGAGGM